MGVEAAGCGGRGGAIDPTARKIDQRAHRLGFLSEVTVGYVRSRALYGLWRRCEIGSERYPLCHVPSAHKS